MFWWHNVIFAVKEHEHAELSLLVSSISKGLFDLHVISIEQLKKPTPQCTIMSEIITIDCHLNLFCTLEGTPMLRTARMGTYPF